MEPFVNFVPFFFSVSTHVYIPPKCLVFRQKQHDVSFFPKTKKKYDMCVADAQRDAISNEPSSLLLFSFYYLTQY